MAWRSEKIRFWFPIVFLSLCLVGLGVRLSMLHLGYIEAEKAPVYTFTRATTSLRGSIFSSMGVPYTCTKVVWEYALDPKAANEDPAHPGRRIDSAVRKANIIDLSESLNLPQVKVMDAYAEYARSRRQYVPLTTNEDETVHARLSKIHGLSVSEKVVRVYPQGRNLSQVIGFVTRDPTNSIGGAGIEQRFERYLKGTSGYVKCRKDAHGREIPGTVEFIVDPHPGKDVYLTIDHNIQHEVENILMEGRLRHQAKRVWAIVLDVKTGAVLAMATTPGYDPGNFTASTDERRKNYAISQVYDPGSVMKTITACAAINEGMVGPNTVMSTGLSDPRYYRLPTDSHKMDDFMTVRDALVHSCNVIYGKLGYDLGPRRMWSYMTEFGFGKKTGIELPGEEKGLVPPWRKWDKLKQSRAPIGQGISVTAIQLAAAYACIANDGELVQPYIVERIMEHDKSPTNASAVVYQHKRQVVGHPIRPETARKVRAMMIGVAKKGGTARRAAIRGYTVAGKTGTAQIARPKKQGGGYYDDKFNASFIGIVPASKPQVVILVTYQEPFTCRRRDTSEQRGVSLYNHQGGICAARTFKKIAKHVLSYLAVEPDMPKDVPEEGEEEDDDE